MAKFRTQYGSYNPIEGEIGIILYKDDHPIAEIIRRDPDHTVRLEIYQKNIPESWLEHLIARGRLLLDPFDDGTPLSQAQRCPAHHERLGRCEHPALDVRGAGNPVAVVVVLLTFIKRCLLVYLAEKK